MVKKRVAKKKAATSKKSAAKTHTAVEGGIVGSIRATAVAIVDEVENASDIVLKEVREGLGTVTDKVSSVARTASGTVSDTQAAQLFRSLIEEVEEVGESLLAVVGQRLDQLRGKVATETGAPVEATTVVKKKAATKKKATSRKKAVSKKKVATKKKATTKKKAASKKKVTTKKKVSAKKAGGKKRS